MQKLFKVEVEKIINQTPLEDLPIQWRNFYELLDHGAGNAVPGHQIERSLKIDRKEIHYMIESMLLHGYFIGATRNKPSGYFIVDSFEDLDKAIFQKRQQALKMLANCIMLEENYYKSRGY